MSTIRSTAVSKCSLVALAVLAGVVLPVGAQADMITFPVKIDKSGIPIFMLKIGDNTITVAADTGNNDRLVFGKDTAATLKLPDNGAGEGSGKELSNWFLTVVRRFLP